MRDPYLDDGDVIVYPGDCVEVMRELPDASINAVVTDPPYALNFMGKAWDSFKGNPDGSACEHCGNDDPVVGYRLCLDCLEAFDEQQLRKATMLGQVSQNWSEKATHSRGYADNNNLAFQRWTTLWAREAYRVLRPGGHLLAFAGTRTYHRMASGVEDAGFEIRDCIAWMYGSGFPKSLDVSKAIDKAHDAQGEIIHQYETGIGGVTMNGGRGQWRGTITHRAPATDAAKQWHGWGTALKPAFEPVVVARKPLMGTVAQNVLEHGAGALNIDGCRIAPADGDEPLRWEQPRGGIWSTDTDATAAAATSAGRWPANVVLDEVAGEMLDEQSGIQRDGVAVRRNRQQDAPHLNPSSWQLPNRPLDDMTYGASGGASRFFYTAKASRQDRNVGGLADNTHPTVKPTDLMRWLVRLVTPPGGVVLDPFGGSGSTGLACRAEAVRCILIEREPEYLQIISDRLKQLSLFGGALGE